MNDSNHGSPSAVTDNVIDLRESIVELWRVKYSVFGIALLVVAVMGLYAFTAQPTYRSDVLIQIDTEQTDSRRRDDLSSILGAASPVETEVELFGSRSIVGSAVDQLNLDIVAEPNYLPVIGRAMATWGLPVQEYPAIREHLKSYAWGAEEIAVDRLEVPEHLAGQPLSLIATGEDSFEIYNEEGERLLEGRVGELVNQSLGDSGAEMNILVSTLKAHRGASFSVVKHHRWRAVNDLRTALRISEQGEGTGLIKLSLEGHKPELLQKILTTITNTYLRHNVSSRSQEAEKTLEVLNKHLPSLRRNLTDAEDRLNSYRASVGSVNVGLEAEALLNRLTSLEMQISELNINRDDIDNKFTQDHPRFLEVNQRIAALEKERENLSKELRKLPDEQEKSIRLERDVRVANELYLLLLNKAQEMRVLKAGSVASAKVIDPADLPKEPTKPNTALLLSLGAVLGTTMGVFGALAWNGFRQGVTNPEVIERQLNIPVYASILHSKIQPKLEKSRRFKGSERLIATFDRDSATMEALRTLRTNIHSATQQVEHPVIAITGPAPNIGKSFIAANLAVVLADSDKRILLIDADMRKGHLHDTFAIQSEQGLSGVLSGKTTLQEAVYKTQRDRLHILPCGKVPPNPSELLFKERFAALVEQVRKHYDMVVIDSPPTLAVTDATIIARHSDLNLMVLRSGQHSMGEVKASMRCFQQSDLKIDAFIINDVSTTNSYYVSYYQQYAHG